MWSSLIMSVTRGGSVGPRRKDQRWDADPTADPTCQLCEPVWAETPSPPSCSPTNHSTFSDTLDSLSSTRGLTDSLCYKPLETVLTSRGPEALFARQISAPCLDPPGAQPTGRYRKSLMGCSPQGMRKAGSKDGGKGGVDDGWMCRHRTWEGLGWVGFDDKDTDVTDEIVNSPRLSFNGQVLLTSPFVKK